MIKNLELATLIKYILLLAAYGMGGTQFTNVPILFYRPQKIIPDMNNPSEYYFSDEYPQITSIPMILDLYNDREFYEVIIMTSGYVGKFVAYILLVAFPIKEQYEHYAVYTPILVIGIVTSITAFYQHVVLLTISFFLWFGSFSFLIGLIFSYTYKHFKGKMSENSVIYLNLTWPVVMLTHILCGYFDGHWRSNMVYFTGFTNLILGISLFAIHRVIQKLEIQQEQLHLETALLENYQDTINHQSQQQGKDHTNNDFAHSALMLHNEDQLVSNLYSNNNQKGNDVEKNPKKNNNNQHHQTPQLNPDILITKKDQDKTSFEILKDNIMMFKRDVTQRNNIMIWSLVWNVVGVSFVGCVIAMNRLEGNLYLNLAVSTVFELLGNIAAVWLMSRFSLKNTIMACLYVMGFSYILSVALDAWVSDNSPILKTLASLLPVLVAKGTHETMWNIVIEFQRQVIRVKYHQFSFAVANLFDMSITSTLPTYQYFMEKNGLNQFLGYGIYALVAARASVNFKLFNKNSTATIISMRRSSISKQSNSATPISKLKKQSADLNHHLEEIEQDNYKNCIEMDDLSKNNTNNQLQKLIAL
ncbi:hypothetical protein ABPG72_009212 [Tetrahymena utriculariae]